MGNDQVIGDRLTSARMIYADEQMGGRMSKYRQATSAIMDE